MDTPYVFKINDSYRKMKALILPGKNSTQGLHYVRQRIVIRQSLLMDDRTDAATKPGGRKSWRNCVA
jgi:hypothetical protein